MTALTEIKRIEVADVYRGEDIAGQLRRTTGGTEFSYLPAYLSGRGPALATTLPTAPKPYLGSAGAVPPFFAGLLPEGARLQAVISAVKTSADDELSLLLAVGSDTVGDVRVVPAGEVPLERSDDLPTDPSAVRFRELLIRTTDPSADRLDSALPGVQNKLSDSMISFPISRRRERSMLKLDPAAFPLLTRNEHFFLDLARQGGFTTPRHELIEDMDGETGLLVARFDRYRDPEGKIERLAQEDGCQLLGRYPADKYRITMNELAGRVGEIATSRHAAVLDLILQYAFGWMIGNGDMHAKNYSLQWRRDGVVAATPVYDVISTLPYPLDQHMAMDLDGRNSNFRKRYFVDFGERHGLPSRLTNRRLGELADRIEPGLDHLDDIGYDTNTTERLADTIGSRIASIRS